MRHARETETLAQSPGARGQQTRSPITAGLASAPRRGVSRPAFSREDGLIVVATVALSGWAVDKPDIRWGAHARSAKSIEAITKKLPVQAAMAAPARDLNSVRPDDIRLRRGQIDEGMPRPSAKGPITVA